MLKFLCRITCLFGSGYSLLSDKHNPTFVDVTNEACWRNIKRFPFQLNVDYGVDKSSNCDLFVHCVPKKLDHQTHGGNFVKS